MNQQKLAEAAALIISRMPNKMIDRIKLMKLLYLVEQASIKKLSPMFRDRLCSMEHGPVLSGAYNIMKGDVYSPYWAQYIHNHPDEPVHSLERDIEETKYLNMNDVDIIMNILNVFGHMDTWEIRDLTHKKEVCPEWDERAETHRTSIPITYKDIFLKHNIAEDDLEAELMLIAMEEGGLESLQHLAEKLYQHVPKPETEEEKLQHEAFLQYIATRPGGTTKDSQESLAVLEAMLH